MTKAYHEQSGVTIYHGDCRDVLDEWEGLRMCSFDLLLTDPPYGIWGHDAVSRHDAANGWEPSRTRLSR